MKFEIQITKDQAKTAYAHLLLIFISLVVAVVLSNIYWIATFPITLIEVFVVVMITLSMLDYLNIIQFRKTVIRKTKCCICGRVSKSEYENKILVKVEKFTSKKQGDSEKEIIKNEKIPANPLEGIIINDKVICTDCIKKVKKFG